jgi:DNA primase
VIEKFGLEVDQKRRSKIDEIWIKSPFTGEKTASLHLNLSKNIFKDFSSGKGGGILNFCQDLLIRNGHCPNCYETARWMVENGISSITNLDRNTVNTVHQYRKLRDEKGKKEKWVRENRPILADLRRWFQVDHPELKKRGLSKRTCQYLGCGFLAEKPSGSKSSPLNGRIVFQVRGVIKGKHNLKSVIISHVGRALKTEQENKDGKYWSFPFLKGLEIYNQDKLLLDPDARTGMKKGGLVLVEGFFDTAKLIESGCRNVGALMGSHITQGQVRRLKFINDQIKLPKIIIFLDRDYAGNTGARKTARRLRENGFSVDIFNWEQTFTRKNGQVIHIPDWIGDPGDMSVLQLQWLRKNGKI